MSPRDVLAVVVFATGCVAVVGIDDYQTAAALKAERAETARLRAVLAGPVSGWPSERPYQLTPVPSRTNVSGSIIVCGRPCRVVVGVNLDRRAKASSGARIAPAVVQP